MYKIPANTLFIGKNLVYVPQCHSTNTLASELIKEKQASEGTVVITDHQTAGKGQRGNTWQADAGKNLTFSMILKPNFLFVKDQFMLTVMASLAVQRLVAEQLDGSIKIKWPNDILVNEQKICGMLIENNVSGDKIQHSIIGIGINVNQNSFPISTATSMSLVASYTFDLSMMLNSLLEKLEAFYLRLRGGAEDDLTKQYLSHLYRIGEARAFRVAEKEFIGTIEGVDKTGRLIVKHDNESQLYDLKEIAFVR